MSDTRGTKVYSVEATCIKVYLRGDNMREAAEKFYLFYHKGEIALGGTQITEIPKLPEGAEFLA